MSVTDDQHIRQLFHEFTVESLVFAFGSLEWFGFTPVKRDGAFYIGDAEGNPIDDQDKVHHLASVMPSIQALAPAAIGALEKRGTEGPAGTDATGACLEAYDRWIEGREE